MLLQLHACCCAAPVLVMRAPLAVYALRALCTTPRLTFRAVCSCVQRRSDNLAELCSLYLLIVNYLTGLLMTLNDNAFVSPWLALLLTANAAFLVGMCLLVVRALAPKLFAGKRCRGCVRWLDAAASGGGNAGDAAAFAVSQSYAEEQDGSGNGGGDLHEQDAAAPYVLIGQSGAGATERKR
jgi:hypothetical protein